MGRLLSIAVALLVPAAAPSAIAGPAATVTAGGASVAAPIFTECATTVRPDGTANAYCGDGIPSTEHRMAAGSPPSCAAAAGCSDAGFAR